MTEWYHYKECECPVGPFDSREDAVADAVKYHDGDLRKVYVGTREPIEVQSFLCVDSVRERVEDVSDRPSVFSSLAAILAESLREDIESNAAELVDENTAKIFGTKALSVLSEILLEHARVLIDEEGAKRVIAWAQEHIFVDHDWYVGEPTECLANPGVET